MQIVRPPNTGEPSHLDAIPFGPIPSRRLGRSLGINNIPPKVCSYSCLYCQVGPTTDRPMEPRGFYSPQQIVEAVSDHLNKVRARGESVDFLTFAPDGEPTLDVRLGETIRRLDQLGVPIAVFTNASLLWRDEVRNALNAADWVSVKVDAATESIWRRVNRPHPDLDLGTIQSGIRRFAAQFEGRLVSETMLVDGINDTQESVSAVGDFLADIRPSVAYLAIPTRPTPYPEITAPDEQTVTSAYEVLRRYVPHVECLIGYEGDAFASTGDAVADLLAITAVQPMRSSAVERLLKRDGASRDVVDRLVANGDLAEVTYRGERHYVRRWRR